MSEEDKKNNSTGLTFINEYKSTLKTQNIAFDLKSSFEIDKNNSIYGILGLSYIQIKLRESFKFYIPGSYFLLTEKNILAPSIGFGYKFKINDDFSVRSQFKYSYLNKEIGDHVVKIKSLTNLNIGFAYNF